MSTSTFVAIGDLHLHQNARQPDRLRALDQIIAENVGRSDLAAWLLLGDLFHARSSIQDRNDLTPRLQAMADVAPVLIPAGNHDAPGDLQIFAELRARWRIHVATHPHTLRVRLATGAFASIFLLNYPHRAGLVAAGAAPSSVSEAARGPLEDVIDEAVGLLAEARAAGDITLALAHVNVAGATASSGQPQIGREIELSPALLNKLLPAPTLLGHIHRAQHVPGAESAWYVGSVCRLDWAEIEPKTYTRVTFGPRSWGGRHGDGPWSDNGAHAYDLEDVPINVAPMYHVEGVLARDDRGESGFVGVVKKGPGGESIEPPPSWEGCEVRVRYTFPASERGLLNHDIVRKGFDGAARLLLDPVAVPDRGLRAPAVAAEQTLAGKVRAWCAANGAETSAELLDRLAGLERPDREAILTDLQRRLAATERAALDTSDPEACRQALVAQEAVH